MGLENTFTINARGAMNKNTLTSCPIGNGGLRKILNAICPGCGIHLFGQFGPKFPNGQEWWKYSCGECGYDFSKIKGAPKNGE